MTKPTTDTATYAFLLDALRLGPSEAIEAQEARGQQELVTSRCLPTKGLDAWVKAFGIVVVKPVDGDDLFTAVILPTGWEVRASGHSMWNYLLDQHGRCRARFYYKAAFYDRRAHCCKPDRRWSVGYLNTLVPSEPILTRVVCNSGAEVTSFTVEPDPAEPPWMSDERAEALAEQWLDAYRPNWRDPTAYWDRTEKDVIADPQPGDIIGGRIVIARTPDAVASRTAGQDDLTQTLAEWTAWAAQAEVAHVAP